ncbi:ATP-binding protein [Vannielia sp. SX4]|uniref:ATP-binding protein n=1 Tax=Vannielia sp. SX4 TaxID=3463852 RepID=UPI00405A2E9B
MITSVVLSLTMLLLAAGALYAIYSSQRLARRPLLRDAAIGTALGITVALLIETYGLIQLVAPLVAKSGPLVLAGYLGGPIGAAAAAVFALGARVWMGGPVMAEGLLLIAGLLLTGLAVRALAPPRDWPRVPLRHLALLLIGFAFVQSIVPMLPRVSAAIGALGSPVVILPGILLGGAISIVLTWALNEIARRTAHGLTEKDELLARMGIILPHAGVGTFRYYGESNTYHVDEGFMRLYGLSRPPGPIDYATFDALVHPDDRARMARAKDEAEAGSTARDQIDIRAIRADGTPLEIRLNWVVFREAPDGPVEMVGVHRDLTDIRRAQQALDKAEQRSSTIAANLPGVVVQLLIDEDGSRRLTYIGPKCLEVWGYPAEEVMADNALIRSGQPPEDVERFVADMRAALARGAPIRSRIPVTDRIGTTRWMEFYGSGTPLPEGGHQVDGIFIDVSAEVAARAEADHNLELAHSAQRNEAIGKLTGGVAHDFNNILAVILGNLELLREDTSSADRLSLIDAAIEASQRGAQLTRAMLAFARKSRLDPEVVDLNDIARQSDNWMRRALPTSVSVETSLLGGLWPVLADPATLESALLNLIVNARDAMEGKGSLTIETANVRIDQSYIDARNEEIAPGRYVMLAVSDTGTGIAPEELPHIFEPFYSTKPPASGSGLGLSMVMGFVRQSGGTVQVYSEPGTGTTFKLYFPAADGTPMQPAAPAPVADETPPTGKRLLLAEDESGVNDVLLSILTRAGYEVTATATGDAALAAFLEEPEAFDVVLTDIVMPGALQGTGLARALRARRPDLPIVFLSGYASEATVHGNGLHADDIRLMKPVPRDELLAAVERAMAQGATPG